MMFMAHKIVSDVFSGKILLDVFGGKTETINTYGKL